MSFIHRYLFIITFFLLCISFFYFTITKLNHSYANAKQLSSMESNQDISFYWIVLIVGGVILLTLSYVSLRKYIGHKKVKRKQSRKS